MELTTFAAARDSASMPVRSRSQAFLHRPGLSAFRPVSQRSSKKFLCDLLHIAHEAAALLCGRLTDGPSTLSRWFARTSMLNPSARALLFEKRNSDVRRIADVRPNIIRQLFDPRPIWNSLTPFPDRESSKFTFTLAPRQRGQNCTSHLGSLAGARLAQHGRDDALRGPAPSA
jgi:hypothetical protein